jgi:hypothetical protein
MDRSVNFILTIKIYYAYVIISYSLLVGGKATESVSCEILSSTSNSKYHFKHLFFLYVVNVLF